MDNFKHIGQIYIDDWSLPYSKKLNKSQLWFIDNIRFDYEYIRIVSKIKTEFDINLKEKHWLELGEFFKNLINKYPKKFSIISDVDEDGNEILWLMFDKIYPVLFYEKN